MIALEAIFVLLVVAGTVPVLSGGFQFVVVGLSVLATHLERAQVHLPRVAVLIPAWNEGAVIGATIDRLMQLEYPRDRLRIYVVDDASSDETPIETIARTKRWPRNVFHIRRVAGGEGKAHTLNYGLEQLWKNDWCEAVLIMDADVIYTPTSLRRMARHLADPKVGAVTAYIKEGSRSPNFVQRFVTFEYITATGAARRAQNVLGFLACLSGGAQLHSRENLLEMGGKIFDDTLAEDTFTTFNTQLSGRRAIFEPNAIVYAEEPDSLDMLWKQRLRWARGNVQITQVFAHLWFRRSAHSGLGSTSMGLLWFSIFLMPVLQIGTAIGLLGLYVMDPVFAWSLFRAYWIVAAIVYLLVTLASYAIDGESARKSWWEGVIFPGALSWLVIVYSLCPPLFAPLGALVSAGALEALTVFLYAWTALCLPASYGALWLERRGYPNAARWALYVAGYGPFLCAVTFGAYVKEATGAARTWDKTVKTGKVG